MPKLLREYRDRGAGVAARDLLLLLIDVDHFKSINDRHSHGVGDRALALIAGVLKEHIRGFRPRGPLGRRRVPGRHAELSARARGRFRGTVARGRRGARVEDGRRRRSGHHGLDRLRGVSRSCRTSRMRCPGSRRSNSPITRSGSPSTAAELVHRPPRDTGAHRRVVLEFLAAAAARRCPRGWRS